MDLRHGPSCGAFVEKKQKKNGRDRPPIRLYNNALVLRVSKDEQPMYVDLNEHEILKNNNLNGKQVKRKPRITLKVTVAVLDTPS